MSEWLVRVDHREDDRVKKSLRKLEGCTVDEVQLPIGDVACLDLGIERKSPADFFGSLYDSGKVLRQAQELQSAFPTPVLIIHGDVYTHLAELDYSKLPPARHLRSFLAAKASIARLGVSVLEARNDWAYRQLVTALVRQTDPNRPLSERPVLVRKATRSHAEQLSDILCAVDGIGRGQAEKLLTHFKTVRGVAEATQEVLQSLDGVGASKAEAIWGSFNRPAPVSKAAIAPETGQGGPPVTPKRPRRSNRAGSKSTEEGSR